MYLCVQNVCARKDGPCLPCINSLGCCWWFKAVSDNFLPHFGLLSTDWVSYKHQSLPVAEQVHPFMTVVYPMSDDCFQQDNKTRINSNSFLEYDIEFTVLKWPLQSSASNPIQHLWDVVEQGICLVDVQLTHLETLYQYELKSLSNVFSTLLNLYDKQVYLIKCPMSSYICVNIHVYTFNRMIN